MRISSIIFQIFYISQKKRVTVFFFKYIVTIKIHFLKTNYIFWKRVKFSITLYIYLLVCTYALSEYIECNEGTLISRSHRLDFVIVCKITFLRYKMILSKKQLYILIELEILYHPVYLSISLDSFIGKKFEYSEHIVHWQV